MLIQSEITPEVLLELESYIKAGRIGMGLLTLDRAGEALTHELLVDYQKGQPVLHIKNPDGTCVPISTASETLLKEFVEKFIEVGDTMKYSEFRPKLFFMTKKSANLQTISQEVLKEFRSQIEQEKHVLKPSITHVYKHGQEHKLIPYVGADFVWFDLGKYISDEKIKSVEDVFPVFYQMAVEAKTSLTTMASKVEGLNDAYQKKLEEDNKRQDEQIEKLTVDVSLMKQKVEGLTSQLQGAGEENEKRIRKKEFQVQGSEDMVYPVKISYVGGKLLLDSSSGYEYFMGPLFLSFETSGKSGILQIGHMHLNNSSRYYTGSNDMHYCYSHHILNSSSPKHILYDVQNIGPGSFIVYCRGKETYSIWSKHIDFVVVDSSIEEKNGHNPFSANTETKNKWMTNPQNINRDYVVRFEQNIHITKSIVLGTRYEIKVGDA